MPPEHKRLRIVVDTNVLFSALAFPADSPPSTVLQLILNGKVTACLSPFIMEELERTLRERADWEEERLVALRKRCKAVFEWVVPTTRLHVIRRLEADNRILECAVDAKADVLVTGNMRDIRPLGAFQGIDILTPREFLHQHSQIF